MARWVSLTRPELEQLRRIGDVLRMGHLLRVEDDRVILDGGTVAMDREALYLDCTAVRAEKWPATAIFGSGRITLQKRPRMCVPLPHPDTDLDWLRLARADYGNQLRWPTTRT